MTSAASTWRHRRPAALRWAEGTLRHPRVHDDQHGTAIVVAAACPSAIKVTGKEMGKVKIVINAGITAVSPSGAIPDGPATW